MTFAPNSPHLHHLHHLLFQPSLSPGIPGSKAIVQGEMKRSFVRITAAAFVWTVGYFFTRTQLPNVLLVFVPFVQPPAFTASKPVIHTPGTVIDYFPLFLNYGNHNHNCDTIGPTDFQSILLYSSRSIQRLQWFCQISTEQSISWIQSSIWQWQRWSCQSIIEMHLFLGSSSSTSCHFPFVIVRLDASSNNNKQ